MIPQDKSGAVGRLSSNGQTLIPVLVIGGIRLSTALSLHSQAGHLPGFASFTHP